MSIALLERENTVSESVKNALEPDVWVNHLKNDLMKFWDKPAAYELQDGLFPTYRSNIGERIDPNNLPDELKAALADDNTAGLWKPIIILSVRIQGRLMHTELLFI